MGIEGRWEGGYMCVYHICVPRIGMDSAFENMGVKSLS
jgi:hypothetical protein